MVLFTFVSVSAAAAPMIELLALFDSVTLPLPDRLTLAPPILSVPPPVGLPMLIAAEFVRVPEPVTSSVAAGSIATVPELVRLAILTTSFVPYSIKLAPELLVNDPLTFTILEPPEKPVVNWFELFTLPVTDSVVFDPAPSDKFSPCAELPLLMVNVPPLGVTACVTPSFRFSVPSTLVSPVSAEVLPALMAPPGLRVRLVPLVTSVIPCPVYCKVSPVLVPEVGPIV